MYQQALKLRSELKLGEGSFDWISKTDALRYQNGKVQIVHNFSGEPIRLTGEVVISSMPLAQDGSLLPNDTAWVLI
jgi:alpha-glucosidase